MTSIKRAAYVFLKVRKQTIGSSVEDGTVLWRVNTESGAADVWRRTGESFFMPFRGPHAGLVVARKDGMFGEPDFPPMLPELVRSELKRRFDLLVAAAVDKGFVTIEDRVVGGDPHWSGTDGVRLHWSGVLEPTVSEDGPHHGRVTETVWVETNPFANNSEDVGHLSAMLRGIIDEHGRSLGVHDEPAEDLGRFRALRSIQPIVGPMGDDLLLRAIHAGLVRNALFQDDYVTEAIRLGLVRRMQEELATKPVLVRVTELGALYWQTRGGDFSNFIYKCPPLEALRLRPRPEAEPSLG